MPVFNFIPKFIPKKTIVPLLIGLSFTPNAHAWRLGDPIGKVIEDAAKDIETAVQNLGRAAADVVTLGEEGRRRDQREAEQARETARIHKEHAERLRQERISKGEYRVVTGKKMVAILERQELRFKGLKHILENSIRSTDLLAKKLMRNELELSTVRELIGMQQADLAIWSTNLGDAETIELVEIREDIQAIHGAIKYKVASYAEQISKIPQAVAEQGEVSSIDEAISAGFEAMLLLDREIANGQASLAEERVDLVKAEAELADLKAGITN